MVIQQKRIWQLQSDKPVSYTCAIIHITDDGVMIVQSHSNEMEYKIAHDMNFDFIY